MVFLKNNFLILCATGLTSLNVGANVTSSFGEIVADTNVKADEVEFPQRAWGETLLNISM